MQPELRYGVMVALGILVPSVQVRILVSQPKKAGHLTGFHLLFALVPLLHHIEGLLLASLLGDQSLSVEVILDPDNLTTW